ncbi:MAG TPA: hypothetical protein VH189_05180 [Rhizomicrobium sp.]|jgi:hypothetical protein|nr:hypothetical protein [Rhizomicrobium sp.]
MKAEILPPLSATLHIRPARWRSGFKLWLPLFLLWLLMLPLLLLALPLLFIAAMIFGVRFWSSIRAALGVLAAFHGTSVEVEKADTRVFIDLH